MDEVAIQRVANLEWINYEAALATAQATPGFDLIMRNDVIITSSEVFPSPDTTHACLLRSTPAMADPLIAEIVAYFRAKNLSVTIFVSPACTPSDLSERLLGQGFVRQEAEEAWLTFDKLLEVQVPALAPGIVVRQVSESEVLAFAHVFMVTFDLPLDLASDLAQLITPSVGLPGVYHYLAIFEEQPIGVCSLICYKQVGILGSAGIIPAWRGSRAMRNLFFHMVRQAQHEGVDTLILQTTAGTPWERLVRLQGFQRVFTRVGFTLT